MVNWWWALVVVAVIGAVAYWAYSNYGGFAYKPKPKFYHVGPQKQHISLNPVSDIPMGTALAAIPGAPGEFLVGTKDGKVYYWKRGTPKKLILDLTKQPVKFTAKHMEQGLMGLTFHPENDRVYLSYSTVPRSKGVMDHVLGEYRLKHKGDIHNSAWELQPTREVFRQGFREKYHHAGSLGFGPDGALYMSTGDGGPQGDPYNVAQNPRSYLGKILRFDVNKHQIGGVPPQIVAGGFRNPYRMSFDEKGQLWVGDVGYDTFESLYKFSVADVVSGGREPPNFGWGNFEGSKRRRGKKPFSAFEPPIFEYPTSKETGRSIIGGEFDEKTNTYVFGDWIGVVRSLQYNQAKKHWEQVGEQRLPAADTLFSFGKDQNTGDIYALGQKKIYAVTMVH